MKEEKIINGNYYLETDKCFTYSKYKRVDVFEYLKKSKNGETIISSGRLVEKTFRLNVGCRCARMVSTNTNGKEMLTCVA